MSLTSSGAAALITPALTTTFVPSASTCTENRLTMLANRAFEIWMNVPVPVPGSTFTDCYPSQFATSYLLAAGGVTQPAFNPLVCPVNYSTMGPYTSNYIACCPSGYSFAEPTVAPPSDRPAFGGTCYTPLPSGVSVPVTAYGSNSVTATTVFAATATNAQAYAYPYEGFAFGVAQVASLVTPTGAAASSTTPTSSVPAATHTVTADTSAVFTPSSLNASTGDTVIFQFESGNHTVTQSTFDRPCQKVENGFDSGYMPNLNGAVHPAPQISFNVSSNSPQWFYSKQADDCGNGMTFALNPTTEQTESTFHQLAISQNGTQSSTAKKENSDSKAVKIGVGISVGLVALMLIGLGIFLSSRRRRDSSEVPDMSSQPSKDISDAKSGVIYGGREWSTESIEEKPPVPPKAEELHDICSPVELAGPSPFELPDSSTKEPSAKAFDVKNPDDV